MADEATMVLRVRRPGRKAAGGPRLPALGALAALAAPPGVLVAAGVALAVVGALAAGVALAFVGCCVLVAGLAVGSPRRLLAALAARPADPVAEARLVGLVDSLCVTDGLAPPRLRVLDDPAPNALTLGTGRRDAVVVVTSGLLGLLDRLELEAVVGHELSHIKRGDLAVAAAATRATALLALVSGAAGVVVLHLAGPAREALADQAAVRVTRYPPALAAALEKLRAAEDTTPKGISPTTARLTGALWCSPLADARSRRPLKGALDVADRALALREL